MVTLCEFIEKEGMVEPKQASNTSNEARAASPKGNDLRLVGLWKRDPLRNAWKEPNSECRALHSANVAAQRGNSEEAT